MLKVMQKDITTVNKGVIAHGCNAQGVMGSGVAQVLRAKYPQIYEAYRRQYDEGCVAVGMVQLITIEDDLYVANLITQEHYGRIKNKKYADINAIETTIKILLNLKRLENLPIFIPKIGCGLGGLKWDDVHNRLTCIPRSDRIIVCDWQG